MLEKFRKFLKRPLTKSRNRLSSVGSVVKLNEHSIALDLGANIGKVAKEMAEVGATVYAFEPNPYAYNVLVENLSGFPKVTCINAAVYDSRSTLPLYFHENSLTDQVKWSVGSSLLSYKRNVSASRWREVETIDLAEFIFSLNKKVDFIKMDVEGVECRLINHLISTGAISVVSRLVAETHDHKISELKEETTALRKRITKENLEAKISLDWI